jgi:hypothetical protein
MDYESEMLVRRWYQLLTERDARKLVECVPGSVAYGMLKAYYALPEAAKQLVRDAYLAGVQS